MAVNPSVVPVLARAPRASDFLVGASLPFRALGVIRRSPRLRVLSLICALVTLVSLVALLVLLWRTAPDLLGVLWDEPSSWYGRAAWQLSVALVFVVLLLVGANTVPLLLLTPLQDPLSEATEAVCGDVEAGSGGLGAFARGFWTGLVHTVARIVFLLLGHLVLLPLNFVPGVGSLAWTVLGSLWTMVWVTAEHVGSPMARHDYRFSQVRQVLAERRALALGFGAGTYVLLWVPVLNTFLLPLAVVGGTLLYRGLRSAGALPPPARAA